MAGGYFDSAENGDTMSKEAFEQLLQKQAENSLDLNMFASRLTALGSTLSQQFQALGHIEDAEKALSCQRLAIKLTSALNPDFPNLLNNLGNTYQRRFMRFKETADFNEATELLQQAISLTPTIHTSKPGMLGNLGALYLSRFYQQRNNPDIEKAIDYLNQAVGLCRDSDTLKPGMLHNLGKSYLGRFSIQGQEEDLEKSIKVLHQAIPLCTDEQQVKADILDALSASSLAKFELSDNLSTLEDAVAYVNQAIMLTPIGRSDRSERLRNAGQIYTKQFDRRGRAEDIHNSINCLIQAVSLCDQEDRNKARCLNDLGVAYQNRYRLLGQSPDIEDSIKHLRQAIDLTSDSDMDETRTFSYNNLGSSYQLRFTGLGSILDLDRAVNYCRLAVERRPEGHQDRSFGLYSLGGAYFTRYEQLKQKPDLDEGIRYLTLGVSSTPDGDPRKPAMLNAIGLACQSRFCLLDEPSDIDDAINFQGQANHLTPSNHADKPQTLANLGIAYNLRFKRRGDRSDIDLSIALVEKSIALTPEASSALPHRLEALGNSYETRYLQFGNLADSAEATQCYEKAVLLIPDGHMYKPTLLLHLGNSYFITAQHNHLVWPEGAVAGHRCLQQAANSPTGDPRAKIVSAGKLAFGARSLFGDYGSSMLAYQRAIDLLQEVAWLGLTVVERYKTIGRIEDLAREAAACAISISNYKKALEWLEEGRSIVWNQILQLRTPLEELSAIDSGLASRLESINRQLEQASTQETLFNKQMKGEPDLERDAQHHRQLASLRDELLQQAREIPGFENYMRPQQALQLLQNIKGKVVVVVNVHSSRCDAMIIRPHEDRIIHVPLESFSFEKALEARMLLASLVGNRGNRAGGFKRQNPRPSPTDPFKGMLETLWSDVAKPILASLNYTEKRTLEELPHVTWCTTGPLSFLPLHAAGCYDGQQPNVSDLIVSSYIPTLSALITSNSQTPSGCPGILTVGQENTAGLGYLPNTVPELAEICQQAKLKGIPLLQLDGENAKVTSVLQAMDQYSSVHLACHASQTVNDPTQSAFYLYDGNLTLAAITKSAFKNKELAFLSACQTATGDSGLPDEAVHLAAGMLMAGYPSVIATMWSIDDEDAPEVAQLVYSDLLADGRVDHRKAARALHKAARKLREKVGEMSFARWIPFIHMGV